jgi:hypothetical protein
MGDGFEVDPASLRSAAGQLERHAGEVASHGESLDAQTAGAVGRGAIGEVVESTVRRGIRIVAHDLSRAVAKFYSDAAGVMRKAAAETERRDGEARSAFDDLARGREPEPGAGSPAVASERSTAPRGARTGYRRSPFIDLSPEEVDQIKREFSEIGGDPTTLRFNTGGSTGYLDGDREIQVSGDVFPSGPPDPLQPNGTMTSRAVLAHELGHHHYDVGEDHPDYLPPGVPEDEMRASRWAAEHVPGLTDEERRFLILDAQNRGAPLPSDPFVRRMLYGITEAGSS